METKQVRISTPPETETHSELLYRTRSEEVQEIIGRMPSWIIRWGVTVIGLLVVGAFIGAALIKSPDVVSCKVTIAASQPPLIIHRAENIQIKELLVKEGDFVKKGSHLAVLDNAIAEYQAILEVKQLAQAIDTSLHLKKALEKLSLKEPVALGQLQYLYTDLEASVNHYLHDKLGRDTEYRQQQNIRADARKLMLACENWEQQYLLISTTAGQVNFLRTLHNGISVRANEAIMAIVKSGSDDVITTGQVPLISFSEIKEGQTIRIQLNDYPLQEFGMLKGKVSRRSAVPVNGLYTLDMTLDNGLITTTGKKILCPAELQATGEIVLKNKSLLQKLFEKY